MKCPICGHRLARLADPCLNCAAVLSGRAHVHADTAAVPTSLTLPAELRVADILAAEAPALRVLAGVPTLRERPAKVPAKPLVASVDLSGRVSRTSPMTTMASDPAMASGQAESGRTIAGSAIRTWAVAGVVAALMVVYLGALRHRNPAQTEPAILATDAANDGRVAPAAALPAVVPATTVRRGISPALASPVTAARLKSTPPNAKTPDASLSVALPPVAVVAVPAPAQSVPVPEPVLPVAARPGVTDLREACGKLGFVARALCVNERCAQAAYAGDAECVKLRKASEEAEQAVQRGG